MANLYNHKIGANIAAFKSYMPKLLEMEVENWYKTNIIKGGWQTSRNKVQKWKPNRKHRYGHPVLRETNSLVNSIKARLNGSRITVSYGNGEVSRRTKNDDYGMYHNTGDGNQQRKFFGDSPALVKHLEDVITKELKNILRGVRGNDRKYWSKKIL